MSLSRAFTTRRLRGGSEFTDGAKTPQRSNTTKGSQDIRNRISAPLQLLHTTNMLSYNAPDIPRSMCASSTNSKSSSDADSQSTADSTPPSSPDVASTAEPNHLSCYFKAAGSPPSTTTSPSDTEAPAIPQRSPSRTKKNSYDAMARQRSVSRMSRDSDQSSSTRGGPTFSRAPSTSTRASSASTVLSQKMLPLLPPASSTALTQLQANKETHPFGQELAQVTELAEEYKTNNRLDVIDEEQQYLANHGLYKFCPDDYLSAIQGLSAMFFPERTHAAHAPLWI